MAFYTIRPKSGTATQWSTANPVLREREIGFEYPDGGLGTGEIKMKMGDGVTAWNDLEYAIMPLYIRDGQGNAVYDIPITPQPNLLDNADFKSGIINQRGEDSYTGSTSKNVYTIDRWSINTNTANTLSIENGYITCTLANNGLLTQYIDSELSGAITCAIKLKNEDLKVVTVSAYSSAEENLIYDFGELETGVNVKAVKDVSTTNKWRLKFQNVSGSNKTLNIEYIKLEKGSIYTGMPQWDEILETYKCICKQFLLGNGWANQYPARSDASVHRIFIALPFKPKKSPSVVILNETKNGNVTLSGNVSQTQNLNINTINFVSISGNGVYLDIPLGTAQQIGYGTAVFNVPVMLDFNEY